MRIVAALLALLALLACAGGAAADNGVLNQTQLADATGDAQGGPDLSGLTVTTYADGTISFQVQFANRDMLHPGETAQIFVDLDNDGKPDLNLSIWPREDPSYLARWGGSDWIDVRQLPELAQGNGGFSVRLSLADLQGAAQLPTQASLGVLVASWTYDETTGKLAGSANDWLPDSGTFASHRIQAPPPVTTTTNPGRPPTLAVACVNRHVTATVLPGSAAIVSVAFYANGALRVRDGRSPFVDAIAMKGLRRPVTITASVRTSGGTHTLHARAPAC